MISILCTSPLSNGNIPLNVLFKSENFSAHVAAIGSPHMLHPPQQAQQEQALVQETHCWSHPLWAECQTALPEASSVPGAAPAGLPVSVAGLQDLSAQNMHLPAPCLYRHYQQRFRLALWRSSERLWLLCTPQGVFCA